MNCTLPYPCAKVAQLVTRKNSSTCLGRGAAPENMRRTRPPNASFIYENKNILRTSKCDAHTKI